MTKIIDDIIILENKFKLIKYILANKNNLQVEKLACRVNDYLQISIEEYLCKLHNDKKKVGAYRYYFAYNRLASYLFNKHIDGELSFNEYQEKLNLVYYNMILKTKFKYNNRFYKI